MFSAARSFCAKQIYYVVDVLFQVGHAAVADLNCVTSSNKYPPESMLPDAIQLSCAPDINNAFISSRFGRVAKTVRNAVFLFSFVENQVKFSLTISLKQLIQSTFQFLI